MSFLFKNISINKKQVPLLGIIWFGFALIAALAQVFKHSYNNYLIFKGVFWHTAQQKNLFIEYPSQYFDTNHYGPTFSLLIAPFAILPDWLGVVLWVLANAAFLYYAVRALPLKENQTLVILAIAAIEMMTASHNVQFNTMLAAWIVLTFVLVEKEKDFWATLFIAAGFLIKVYGIGALLFFVFSKHKPRFIWSFIFWSAILFVLPMFYSSPRYIMQCYSDWYQALAEKDVKNADVMASGGWQDISVMGLIRRLFHSPSLSNLYVMAPAALLILVPLLRFRQYAFQAFRLNYLALVLISIVIFSSSAESPTYVIAMVGAGVWFVLNANNKMAFYFLVLALVITSLSATDLFPKYLERHYIRPYALKALPCFLIWIWLIVNAFGRDFRGMVTGPPEPDT